MIVRMTSIGLLCLALAQSSLACGGGDAGGRDPGDQDAGDQDAGGGFDAEQVAADLASVLCEASSSCECAMGPAAPATCVAAVAPVLADRLGDHQAPGLRYDEECLAFATAYSVALSCRRHGEAEPDDALAQVEWNVRRCKPLFGDGNLGDPCSSAGSFGFLGLGDTCAPGLACENSQCVELVEAGGEPCAAYDNGPGRFVCPPGTRCSDPDDDGAVTCEPPPAAGEPCDPFAYECQEDLICHPTELLCTERPEPGQACLEGQCAAGNVCANEMCQPAPGEDEPCWQNGCAAGLHCDANTNTCARPVEEGEPCVYPEDCGEGMTCSEFVADGVCVRLPGEGEGCFGGYYCASGLECAFDNRCVTPPPIACLLPFCTYRSDGLCDEPEGSNLCPEGTDPEDCRMDL
jgi:hypothetical protein